MAAFIFEGIDKAGKTTLIKRIGVQTDLKILTLRRPAKNGWESLKEFRQGKEDAESVIKYARENADKVDFLLDRFSYSEIVYAKCFKRPCDFPWYRKRLKENKDILKVIYIDERPDIIYARWEEKGMPMENILKINAEYNNLWNSLGFKQGLDFYKFRPSRDSIDDLISWIKINGKDFFRPSAELI